MIQLFETVSEEKLLLAFLPFVLQGETVLWLSEFTALHRSGTAMSSPAGSRSGRQVVVPAVHVKRQPSMSFVMTKVPGVEYPPTIVRLPTPESLPSPEDKLQKLRMKAVSGVKCAIVDTPPPSGGLRYIKQASRAKAPSKSCSASAEKTKEMSEAAMRAQQDYWRQSIGLRPLHQGPKAIEVAKKKGRDKVQSAPRIDVEKAEVVPFLPQKQGPPLPRKRSGHWRVG